MNNEFKKTSNKTQTVYTLESATSMGSGSIASISKPMGGVRKRGDNLIAQEADNKAIPPSTPRNFVAKNAKSSGAGAHKDKKKAEKQGDVKHKKPYMEGEANISDRELDTIDPQDQGEEEGSFVKNQIHTMLRVLTHLEHAIGDDEDLPEWVQMKLSQAQQSVVGIMDYMISDKEREVERQTGHDSLMKEGEKKGLYYYVNKRKKAGTSRDASSPKAPSAQSWKDAAKTAKKEGVAEGRNEIATGTPDAIKVKIKELGLGPARRESTGSGGEAIFVFRNPNYYISQRQDGNWVLVQTNAESDKQGVAEGSHEDQVSRLAAYNEIMAGENPPIELGLREVGNWAKVGHYGNPIKTAWLNIAKYGVRNNRFEDSVDQVMSAIGEFPDLEDEVYDMYDINQDEVDILYNAYETVYDQWEQSQGVAEGSVKELSMDLKSMPEKEFIAKYNKSKADARDAMKSLAEAFENDESNLFYIYDKSSGRLKQRMIHNNDERRAFAQGFKETPEQALKYAGIIRSKFDPKKFVQNMGGKWVQVFPYGEQNVEKEDHSTATGGWGQGSYASSSGSSKWAGAGHNDVQHENHPDEEEDKALIRKMVKARALKQEDSYMAELQAKLDEKIPKNAPVDVWIKDFEKSNAPQFKGKNLEKRRQMAVAASYGAKNPSKKK